MNETQRTPGVAWDESLVVGSHPCPPPALDVLKPFESKIMVSHGTPLACTSCHRVGMAVYYLKRANAKYDVLCFDNGKGCWEHSSRGLCSYVDSDGAQCPDLSEWQVLYSEDNDLMKRVVCSRHLAGVLGGAHGYRIYPIDNDLLAGLLDGR